MKPHMRPHIKRKNGNWFIYRHKSVASYALPVVIGGKPLRELWKDYLFYMDL